MSGLIKEFDQIKFSEKIKAKKFPSLEINEPSIELIFKRSQ
jgi:hypothetical protein